MEENYDPDIKDTEKNEEDEDLEVEKDFDINGKVEENFDIGVVIFINDDKNIE